MLLPLFLAFCLALRSPVKSLNLGHLPQSAAQGGRVAPLTRPKRRLIKNLMKKRSRIVQMGGYRQVGSVLQPAAGPATIIINSTDGAQVSIWLVGGSFQGFPFTIHAYTHTVQYQSTYLALTLNRIHPNITPRSRSSLIFFTPNTTHPQRQTKQNKQTNNNPPSLHLSCSLLFPTNIYHRANTFFSLPALARNPSSHTLSRKISTNGLHIADRHS